MKQVISGYIPHTNVEFSILSDGNRLFIDFLGQERRPFSRYLFKTDSELDVINNVFDAINEFNTQFKVILH